LFIDDCAEQYNISSLKGNYSTTKPSTTQKTTKAHTTSRQRRKSKRSPLALRKQNNTPLWDSSNSRLGTPAPALIGNPKSKRFRMMIILAHPGLEVPSMPSEVVILAGSRGGV
jgi:hypothetical protein